MDWQLKIIAVEADRLIELAADDAELRADLRALAKKILEATAEPQDREIDDPVNSTSRSGVGPAMPEKAAPPAVVPDRGRPPERLRELTLGRSVPARSPAKPTVAKFAGQDAFEDELAPIEARCRKKADAARWAAAHERWLQQGADLEDETPSPDPEITRWADTLTNGLYWQDPSDPAGRRCLGARRSGRMLRGGRRIAGLGPGHPGRAEGQSEVAGRRPAPHRGSPVGPAHRDPAHLGAGRCRPVASLRLVEGDGRPEPCVYQAIHAR